MEIDEDSLQLGKTPIGFKREDKKLVPDPSMMKWVRWAFDETHKLKGHVAEVMRRLRAQSTKSHTNRMYAAKPVFSTTSNS